MADKEKHTCRGMIYYNHQYRMCGRTARYERAGEWYCGTHDPEKVKARDVKREQKSKEYYDRMWAGIYARQRLVMAMEHFCEGLSVEFMEEHQAKEMP